MTYTLEHYLMTLHTGQWFGWSDSKNKVYANLVIHSDDAKPSESDCTAGVTTLQADWDALDYSRTRKAKYDLLNQDEMRYDDVKNSTTTWVDAIDAIKAAHPKP